MRDRYDVISELLQQDRLLEWQVVRPVPGDTSREVVIEHVHRKRVTVPVTQADVDNLSDPELLRRIRKAILES